MFVTAAYSPSRVSHCYVAVSMPFAMCAVLLLLRRVYSLFFLLFSLWCSYSPLQSDASIRWCVACARARTYVALPSVLKPKICMSCSVPYHTSRKTPGVQPKHGQRFQREETSIMKAALILYMNAITTGTWCLGTRHLKLLWRGVLRL